MVLLMALMEDSQMRRELSIFKFGYATCNVVYANPRRHIYNHTIIRPYDIETEFCSNRDPPKIPALLAKLSI